MGKPKIRFKGYDDDWEQRKFGSLLEETRNKTTVEDEDTLLSCAIDGMYLNSELFSHFRGSSNIGYLKIKKDDLILSAQNLHLGNCNVNLRFEHGIISPAYKVYELVECNPWFMQAWVKKESTKDFFLKASTEGASVCRKNIVWAELYKQELPVPVIEEQTKIGEYFQTIDHLITLHQRKCDQTKKLKKYMLQKMFPQNGQKVPEIRFLGFTNDWEQRKLKETIEYIVDNRGKNPDYYCSEGIPVIDNFMIRNSLYPDLNTATRYIDENLYQSFIRKYNEEDDVLLTLVGNGIGNITLFPKDKAVIIQNTLGFRAKEDKKFLFFLLMANNEALVKLDRGMAQPSIRQDEILDLDIYMPSYSEQVQIGKYFTSLDHLITLHQKKCDELMNIKKFMLQNMFV